MGLLQQLNEEITKIVDSTLPSLVSIIKIQDNDEEVPVGAGIIIQSDGVIVTNYHVVKDCSRLRIDLHDGRSFESDVCGVDYISDIGVLRIPQNDLPVATLSLGQPPRLGEIVLAVGHPLGLTSTVTMGITSAIARLIPSPVIPRKHIQTDAAINPGNSGGALVDSNGSVIGIVTLGMDGQGLSFAIPIGDALKVVNKILQQGKMTYGTIGINGVEYDLPAQIVSRHRLNQETALMVTEVFQGGPADTAAIKEGDCILTINEQQMTSPFLEGDLIDTEATIHLLRNDYSVAKKRLKITNLAKIADSRLKSFREKWCAEERPSLVDFLNELIGLESVGCNTETVQDHFNKFQAIRLADCRDMDDYKSKRSVQWDLWVKTSIAELKF